MRNATSGLSSAQRYCELRASAPPRELIRQLPAFHEISLRTRNTQLFATHNFSRMALTAFASARAAMFRLEGVTLCDSDAPGSAAYSHAPSARGLRQNARRMSVPTESAFRVAARAPTPISEEGALATQPRTSERALCPALRALARPDTSRCRRVTITARANLGSCGTEPRGEVQYGAAIAHSRQFPRAQSAIALAARASYESAPCRPRTSCC